MLWFTWLYDCWQGAGHISPIYWHARLMSLQVIPKTYGQRPLHADYSIFLWVIFPTSAAQAATHLIISVQQQVQVRCLGDIIESHQSSRKALADSFNNPLCYQASSKTLLRCLQSVILLRTTRAKLDQHTVDQLKANSGLRSEIWDLFQTGRCCAQS